MSVRVAKKGGCANGRDMSWGELAHYAITLLQGKAGNKKYEYRD